MAYSPLVRIRSYQTELEQHVRLLSTSLEAARCELTQSNAAGARLAAENTRLTKELRLAAEQRAAENKPLNSWKTFEAIATASSVFCSAACMAVDPRPTLRPGP